MIRAISGAGAVRFRNPGHFVSDQLAYRQQRKYRHGGR
jgi:hypothetical protein